ncbi:hypothetical protein [Nocardioides abyssi]|uniref:Uncharacterized protein n=1 Tax=Nocardioides abyssi TaxID=3058370 RepID=A0ABT8ETI3_9ACTN|nr:hypothetical protein [Nocardioides abyssi]MDN4161321.1 hypothetical protein [Nocardioides abyssi]
MAVLPARRPRGVLADRPTASTHASTADMLDPAQEVTISHAPHQATKNADAAGRSA